MKKGLIILTSLLFILFSSLAIAVEIDSCQDLPTYGESYILTTNISDSNTCITISESNITLDCAGNMINFSTGGTDGQGVLLNAGLENITVQNCVLYEGSSSGDEINSAIYINQSNESLIYNNTVITYSQSANGIYGDGDSNIISHNNVIVAGNFANALYLGINSANPTIDNNELTSSNYRGITFNAVEESGFATNNIITGFRDGIYLSVTVGFNFINNTVITTGDNYPAIDINFVSNNNSFINNTIQTSGVSSYGILIHGLSHFNSFKQVWIYMMMGLLV